MWLSPAEKSTEQREDEEDANEAKGDKETENPKGKRTSETIPEVVLLKSQRSGRAS